MQKRILNIIIMLSAISLLSFAVYSSKKKKNNEELSSSVTSQEKSSFNDPTSEPPINDDVNIDEFLDNMQEIDPGAGISEDIGSGMDDGEINPFSNPNAVENENEVIGDETEAEAEPNKFANTILFYGSTCPHCVIVKEHIIDTNLPVEMKEVYQNTDNSGELMQKAEICGIDPSKIGVPFLWSDGECIVGGENIIDYLNTK